MREFFRGSSRKIGLILLVMALVFMGGWVRSLAIKDIFWFTENGVITFSVESNRGRLLSHRSLKSGSFHRLRFHSHNANEADDLDPLTNCTVRRHWQLCGFEFAEYVITTPVMEMGLRAIPYWSVVIPMTSISLWLLVTKPRKSTVKKINESVPAEEYYSSDSRVLGESKVSDDVLIH